MVKGKTMEKLCRDLLNRWCEGLLQLQIKNTGNSKLDGAILCPACGRIHGRCADAMYPFLWMAEETGEEKWIQAAEALFNWAECTVSQPDGSLWNDVDSSWNGTTVFYAIQLAGCLNEHGACLSQRVKEQWKERLHQAAEFLCNCDCLLENNINYPVSNSLALFLCGQVLGEDKYRQRGEYFWKKAKAELTENGLLYGEGVPRNKKSKRGCRPVDIGYNVEETLPSMLRYGILSGNQQARDMALESMKAHLDFCLEDGGWDNSFGTRNYKWTYWGSRTSDGCALGFLLAAQEMTSEKEKNRMIQAAKKNLELLETCTWNGLLMGGPHYMDAGQQPCVHHTFTHAKVLAEILDFGLEKQIENKKTELRELENVSIQKYPEIDTWKVKLPGGCATITAYDWEYLPGGHVSGGTLSLLWSREAGPVFCAGMGEYSLKEPNNMQIPANCMQECLAVRIEAEWEGTVYSSIYEEQAFIEVAGDTILVRGYLKNQNHERCTEQEMPYEICYKFGNRSIEIQADFPQGILICPVISRKDEKVTWNEGENNLKIWKSEGIVELKTDGKMEMPYGRNRIFNLVPGFQALKLCMHSEKRKIKILLFIKPDRQ